MTEQLLEKAIDLNKKMKSMKEYKEELEEAQQRWVENCTDSFPGEFSIRMRNKNGTNTFVVVSGDSVKIALNEEIKRTTESLTELQREFEEL